MSAKLSAGIGAKFQKWSTTTIDLYLETEVLKKSRRIDEGAALNPCPNFFLPLTQWGGSGMRNRPKGGCRGRSLTAQGRSAILFHAHMFIPIVILVGSIVHQRHSSLLQSLRFLLPSHLSNPNSSCFQPLPPPPPQNHLKMELLLLRLPPNTMSTCYPASQPENANSTHSSQLQSPSLALRWSKHHKSPPSAATEYFAQKATSTVHLHLVPFVFLRPP